jgi:hypothetical protein
MTCTSQADPGEEPCGFWPPGSEVGEQVTRSDRKYECLEKKRIYKIIGGGTELDTDQNVLCARSTEAGTVRSRGEYPPSGLIGKMFPRVRGFEPAHS